MDGIIKSFIDRCPKVTLTALSMNHGNTKALHGINAVNRMSPTDVLSALRESDLLISGGGSLLQDVTSAKSLMYYLAIIWLAKKLRKKVMIYAQGIGPIDGQSSRKWTKSILNKVDLITVRDEASRHYLQRLGVTLPPIEVTADPAFALEPSSDDEAKEILRSVGASEDQALIGVSLRTWKDDVHWLPAVTTGLDQAASRLGAALVFLPMQKDQDESICVEVASKMTVPSVVVPAQQQAGVSMAIIKQMSLMVGMRLHSLIFSSCVGVPFVGIAYDPKVEAFVSNVTREYPLKLEGLQPSHVAGRIFDIWERSEEVTFKMNGNVRELKSLALSNADLACNLLGI